MDLKFFLFKFILIYSAQNSLEVTKKENQEIGSDLRVGNRI